MSNRIRERVSWNVECTVLLVRLIFAIAIVVGAAWYYRAHLHEGGTGIWEVIAALVAGLFALFLFFVILLLPLIGFVIFWFAFCGLLYWLDSREPWKMKSQAKQGVEGSAQVDNCAGETGIHVSRSAPLRRSPVRYVEKKAGELETQCAYH